MQKLAGTAETSTKVAGGREGLLFYVNSAVWFWWSIMTTNRLKRMNASLPFCRQMLAIITLICAAIPTLNWIVFVGVASLIQVLAFFVLHLVNVFPQTKKISVTVRLTSIFVVYMHVRFLTGRASTKMLYIELNFWPWIFTESFVGWGFVPDPTAGVYSALPDP